MADAELPFQVELPRRGQCTFIWACGNKRNHLMLELVEVSHALSSSDMGYPCLRH